MKTLAKPMLLLALLLAAGCGNDHEVPEAHEDPEVAEVPEVTEPTVDIAAEQEKVRQVFTGLMQAIEAGNPAGYFSYVTDDILIYDSGTDPITDSDSLRTVIERFFDSYEMTWNDHRSEEVIIRDDIAIHRHRGTITVTPKSNGEQIEMSLKYLDVLKRGEDGEWKIYIHSSSPIE